MKRMFLALALAATIAGTTVDAQDVEGVTVTGSRIVKERIGRTASGIPVEAISLSYRVSYADLDVSTPAGKAALEKRIHEAATVACKQISQLYPGATPDDVACAKAAVANAKPQVDKIAGGTGK